MEETVVAATSENQNLWAQLIASWQNWLNQSALDMLLSLVWILAVMLAGKILLILLRRVLRHVFNKSRKINDLMASFLLKVVSAIGWIVVAMIVLDKVGVNLAPIIAGLGVTGFILGFAFQESIGNLLSGVMIVLNAPFRIGDYVDVGTLSGTVKEMDMMCVTLATADNKRVTVANKLVWGNAIVNYSFTENRRVEMGISVAYGADIAKVKQLIQTLLESYPEVLVDPSPVVEVNKLNSYSVDLVVRPWTKPADYWTVYFRFQQEILGVLDLAGIEIPFPKMDINCMVPGNVGEKLPG
ncbi:MAG: mechanosensitive ion channel family protein [Sphaerochaetaceae bacterium]